MKKFKLPDMGGKTPPPCKDVVKAGLPCDGRNVPRSDYKAFYDLPRRNKETAR